MAGLLDLFGGQQGGDYPGVQGIQNSLVGLGLGLMSGPTLAGALRGYESGARADATNRHSAQQAREAALNRQMHRDQMAQAERHFQVTSQLPAERAAASMGLKTGTPEYQNFIRSQYKPELKTVTNPEDEMPYYVPQQPGEAPQPVFPQTRPTAAPAAPAVNPAVPYGQAGLGAQGFGSGPVAPRYGVGPTANTPQFAEPQTQTNIWGDAVQPQPEATPNAYQAPAGMKPSQRKAYEKTAAESSAKAIVANQEDAIKSAKAASEFKPAVDEMVAAYQDLIKGGGIGPVVGSEYGPRQIQAVAHGQNEGLRQRYETALRKVQALVTAAQNKGEGAVSNYERQLYAQQFPSLTATDPNSQLPFLNQLQQTTEAAIRAGQGSTLGQSPGGNNMMYPRPPIVQQGGGNSTAFGAEPPARTPSKGAINYLRAKPETRAQFDEWYGPGAAERVLGAR